GAGAGAWLTTGAGGAAFLLYQPAGTPITATLATTATAIAPINSGLRRLPLSLPNERNAGENDFSTSVCVSTGTALPTSSSGSATKSAGNAIPGAMLSSNRRKPSSTTCVQGWLMVRLFASTSTLNSNSAFGSVSA